MILHTVNKSYHSNNCLSDCLSLCAAEASILFIEDGVYCATAAAHNYLANHEHINFYALEADIKARGLIDKLNPTINVIDDNGFVELCTKHNTVQSWY